MSGPRADKVTAVDEVKERLESAEAAILTEYRGLKVGDLAALRRSLRGAGAEYKIFKNTLVRRATAATGTTAMDPLLEGPTAIAFVDTDVAAVAKVLRDFARTNPALVVKGSFVGGSLLDASSTGRLADLPPRETLLAQLAGALAAPLQQMAGLLKALPQNLAYGLSALMDQRRAGGDTSEATAEAATEEPATEEPATEEQASATAAGEAATEEPATEEQANATAPAEEATEASGDEPAEASGDESAEASGDEPAEDAATEPAEAGEDAES